MLMKNSALKELFAEVYEKNNIPHIMTGKAIARSLRAHLSVQSALMTLLIQNAIDYRKNASGFVKIQNFRHSILIA